MQSSYSYACGRAILWMFPTEHPLFMAPGIVEILGTKGAISYHLEATDMKRTLQRPNWSAAIEYYPSEGFTEPLEFSIEQVWDGTAEGHEKLVRQCLCTVEMWRDKFGGHYSCFWGEGPQSYYLKPGASNACVVG